MIIGLCGYPTVGKSEVARILVDKFGYHLLDTKKILRDITNTISGVNLDLTKGYNKDKVFEGQTLRKIMGEVGLTLEELFGEDFLLKKALAEPFIYEGKNIVVDGLRRNQALFFEGKVVEVRSDRRSYAGYSFDEYNRTKIDYTIDNSGDLGQLTLKVTEMLTELAK